MYSKIFVGLDGSFWSNQAANAALQIAAKGENALITACHVYAAQLHRVRFEEMEPGLPESYQHEEKLNHLRNTHESLISDGLELISDSYLKFLVKEAQEKNLKVNGLTPEGRNYAVFLSELVKLEPDLVILGANGHGYVPESQIGSLTERVLTGQHTADMLIMRQNLDFKGRPILAAIDGSQNSFQALIQAIYLAKSFQTSLEAVAVYDPFFHGSVFKAIAGALPLEAQERFNFPAQEKLHDEIIDRGLEKLYREGLEQGQLLAKQEGIEMKVEVLAGKVYPQIHHFAQIRNASLVVLGRWGLHQDPISRIGSNALQFARLTMTNTLIVNPKENLISIPKLDKKEETTLSWTKSAEERLKRIPIFARGMARRSIEEKALAQGLSQVDEAFMRSMGNIMGRGTPED